MILTEDAINKAKQIIKEREETNEIFGFGGLPSAEKAEKEAPGIVGMSRFAGRNLAAINVFDDKAGIQQSLSFRPRDDLDGRRLAAMQQRLKRIEDEIQGMNDLSGIEDEKIRAFVSKHQKQIKKRLEMIAQNYTEAIKKQVKQTPKSKGGEGPEPRKADPKPADSADKRDDGERPANSAQNMIGGSFVHPFDARRARNKARAGSGRPRDTSIGGGPSGGSRRV